MIVAYLYARNFLADLRRFLLTPASGQGLVEYALILILISLVTIVGMVVFGGGVDGYYVRADSQLGDAVGP